VQSFTANMLTPSRLRVDGWPGHRCACRAARVWLYHPAGTCPGPPNAYDEEQPAAAAVVPPNHCHRPRPRRTPYRRTRAGATTCGGWRMKHLEADSTGPRDACCLRPLSCVVLTSCGVGEASRMCHWPGGPAPDLVPTPCNVQMPDTLALNVTAGCGWRCLCRDRARDQSGELVTTLTLSLDKGVRLRRTLPQRFGQTSLLGPSMLSCRHLPTRHKRLLSKRGHHPAGQLHGVSDNRSGHWPASPRC